MLPLPRLCCLALLSALTVSATARAGEWIHWRGPAQNGHSLEKNLPGEFDPKLKDKGNVVWSAPYGGRAAPLVMDGRVYVLQGFGAGLGESERVVCLEEKTGNKLWEYTERIYHADIVSSRLGWTPLTADPATGIVYAHTTAGNLVALDKDGKRVWERQLTEEFGRVSGYGGRIVAPIFDSGLVIMGMLNASWGDQARGANRFIAFDGKTGTVVWIGETGLPLKVTYQSNPVVAVIGGQRLLITGGSDGALHAFKVRTGEKVWSYVFSGGAVNPSPVVSGNLVYCAHGEENPGGGIIGKVICVDASQVDPETKKPKVVWEYQKGQRFGLASPALAGGVLYMPEDSGDLFAFDAKTGKVLWKYRYATEVRGAPLVADGKIYIFDVKGRLNIIKLVDGGKKAPDEDDTFVYTFKENIAGKVAQTETNGTPVAVNGRVYFNTRTDLYCLGDPKAKVEEVKYPPVPEEAPFNPTAVAGARLYPAEITAKPGDEIKFQVVLVDANGREVKGSPPDAKPEWSIAVPGKTPTGALPPPLAGKLTDGTLLLEKNPAQQGYVDFKLGAITARARVRVAPRVPLVTDFEKTPVGASPAGWINVNAKFIVYQMPDGNKVLSKVNNVGSPAIAKAMGYITGPEATDYTIQADVMGTVVRDKLPDAGLVNSRYALLLDGKPDPNTGKRTLRISAWEARPRINAVVEYDWQPDTWYTLKFAVEPGEKSSALKGKIWKKGDPEPEKWTVTFEDPNPTPTGAAGLFGYIPNVLEQGGKIEPGSALYFDNLSITPNKKTDSPKK